MSPELHEYLHQEIRRWQHSQQGQTSGYDYEKTFVETWTRLGQEVFEEQMGHLPKSRNLKKDQNDPRLA